MAKLISTMFFVEPNNYALQELVKAEKKPIRKCVICCFENEPGHLETIGNVINEHFDDIIALDWAHNNLATVALTMSEMLTMDTGFQVFCAPMESMEVLEVIPVESHGEPQDSEPAKPQNTPQ